MSVIPDRIFINDTDRALYEKIENEVLFKEKTRKEQFLFAMAFGFKNKVKYPLAKREGFFLTKDLRPEDEALLNVVAIEDSPNSVEILSDMNEVFKTAEEYAHAGIKLLVDKIETIATGTFEKQFEQELHEAYSVNMSEDDEKNTSR